MGPKKSEPKRRSWAATSALLRTGGGPHKDRRTKRQGGRTDQRKRSVQEGW